MRRTGRPSPRAASTGSLEWRERITTSQDARVLDYIGQHYARSPEYARKQFGVRDGEYTNIKKAK